MVAFLVLLKSVLLAGDKFPARVELNFNKKSQFGSWVGLVASCLVYALVAAYSVRKGQILVHRENPDIAYYENREALTPTDAVGFRESN